MTRPPNQMFSGFIVAFTTFMLKGSESIPLCWYQIYM
jgi:hypothetical protein